MYKFLQRNNKKLLAVFAIGLMIVFILPSTSMHTMGDPVVGRMGDTEFHATRFQSAELEWNVIKGLGISQPGMEHISLVEAVLGPAAARQIDQSPELYLVLQEEAKAMGIAVAPQRVDEVLYQFVRLPAGADPGSLETIRSGVEHLLLLKSAYDRASSVIKISQPLRRHELASQGQALTLKLVEFSSDDFAEEAAATTQPSAEQLQAHFEKYADVLPGGDEFGFGYRVPNRVKLQYIRIPVAAVEDAVELKKSPYDWQVEARKYYLRNQSQFPATQPSATGVQDPLQSFMGDALATPATRPSAGGPTTRPFEQVSEQIQRQLVRAEAQKLAGQIQADINATLGADWLTYQRAIQSDNANPTTKPSGSALGPPYNSYEYLQALAQRVQKRFGVLPVVTQIADRWIAFSEIGELPDIGQAGIEQPGDIGPYLEMFAEPMVTEERRGDSKVLSPYEPSPAFYDGAGNAYVVRLTEIEPAHKAADLASVREQVALDLRRQAAFEATKKAAGDFLAAANRQGLATAAAEFGKTVVTTGEVRNAPGSKVEHFPLDGEANAQFTKGAFDLLKSAAAQNEPNPTPIGIIPLPASGKIVVAQLEKVTAPWDGSTIALAEQSINQQLRRELEGYLQMMWYNPDSILARTRFTFEDTSVDRSSPPAAPSRPPVL